MGQKIVFLSYLSRSGSTYMSSLLHGHPEILVTIEADFPRSMFGIGGKKLLENQKELRRYVDYILDDAKFRGWGVTSEEILARVLQQHQLPLAASCLLPVIVGLYAAKSQFAGQVIIFKGCRPAAFNFDAVHKAFSGCLMLCLVRDPRAVYCSQKRARYVDHGVPLSSSPLATAKEWVLVAQSALQWRDEDSFMVVQYENLLEDLDAELKRVFKWVQCEPMNSEHLMFDKYAHGIPKSQQYLHRKIAWEPDPARVDRWRKDLHLAEIQVIEELAGRELEQLSYRLRAASPGARLSLPRYLWRWKWCVNSHRARSIFRVRKYWKYLRHPHRLCREVQARRLGW